MSRRWNHAASSAILLGSLACPILAVAQAVPQASGAPTSDDSVPPITVQIAPPPLSLTPAMLGGANPLGAQPVAGKPISAEIVTEHRQSFVDGNHISRSTRSGIYRDAQGRIRRESQLSLPGLPPGTTASTFITIVDHQKGFGYVLDPQEMVAHRYQLNGPPPSYVARLNAQTAGFPMLSIDGQTGSVGQGKLAASDAAAAPANNAAGHWRLHGFASHHSRGPVDTSASFNSGFISSDSRAEASQALRIDQPLLAAPNPVRTENLGEQVILGYAAKGTRVITTLPAGQIGNDRPIDIVSEQWFSPELGLVMRSMHRDPWAGEFTTSVTRVSRGDQSEALFEVPAQYKVIDSASEGERHVLDGASK